MEEDDSADLKANFKSELEILYGSFFGGLKVMGKYAKRISNKGSLNSSTFSNSCVTILFSLKEINKFFGSFSPVAI